MAFAAARAAAPVAVALFGRAARASRCPPDYYELARQRGISLKDLRHEIEMQCIRRALLEARDNTQLLHPAVCG